MIRRDFVKRTLGAGLVSSLAASASTAGAAVPVAKRSGSGRRKPRIMYFNDSRHDLVYHYEPPMSKRQFEAPVDELVGTSVEAVCLGLGDGRTVFHDTKVSEVWGDPVDKWSHAVFHRAGQNVRAALDQGVDPAAGLLRTSPHQGNAALSHLAAQPGTARRFHRGGRAHL